MNFIITNSAETFNLDSVPDLKRLNLNENNILFIKEKIKCKEKFINNKKIFIFGDLIIPQDTEEDKYLHFLFSDFSENKIRDISGFFYLVIAEESRVLVINSIFSILPLYYYESGKYYIISSNIELIKEYTNISLNISYKYLIEKILFNYSFLKRTVFKQISLLDSNSYIDIKEKISIRKHINIEEFYANNPKPWKKSLGEMSELFISRVKDYLPNSLYYSSFTGGFDGRAIVACGLYYKKDFITYSYGERNRDDVEIPSHIATDINIRYLPLIIDEDYSRNQFVDYSKLFVYVNSLNGSISRSHYAWMTDVLKRKTDYIVSGNFGSEIIRTAKNPGVMTSELLFDLFEAIDNTEFKKKVSEYKKLKYFQNDFLNTNLNEIIDELIDFRDNYHINLNENQRFYVYLFEEVFRKYFGPEIYYECLNGLFNRSPFLDFAFLKELFKTKLAGVNSNFKEENPFKRYKGQILYAYIINKTFPQLGKYQSDKDYKPDDFLSYIGNIKIFVNYFRRIAWNQYILGKDKNYTPYNHRNILLNRAYFLNLFSHEDIFDVRYLKEKLTTSEDALFHILSCILYIKNH